MNLWIDVTQECNNKCLYCPQGCDYPSEFDEEPMSHEDIMKIVERLSSDMDMKKLVISGGEPLYDLNTIKTTYGISDYCRDKGIFVELFTNGIAFFDNRDLFEDVYKHVDFVHVGIHHYNMLDSFFEMMRWKDESQGYLAMNFIINKERGKYVQEIKRLLEEFGFENRVKNDIFIRFYDMIPFNDNWNLALPRDSNVMDDLRKYVTELPEDIQNKFEVQNRLCRATPSSCSISKNDIIVDNYGNVRFCLGFYGPRFGNLKNETVNEILMRKKRLIDVLEVYDPDLIVFDTAKELSRENGIHYSDYYRVYCAIVLQDLFKEYKIDDMDRMVLDFESMLSERNPLRQIDERYVVYEQGLELWQRRALQTVLNSDPLNVLKPDTIAYSLSGKLPEPLSVEVKKDMFFEILKKRVNEIDQGMIRRVWSLLNAKEQSEVRQFLGVRLNAYF